MYDLAYISWYITGAAFESLILIKDNTTKK